MTDLMTHMKSLHAQADQIIIEEVGEWLVGMLDKVYRTAPSVQMARDVLSVVADVGPETGRNIHGRKGFTGYHYCNCHLVSYCCPPHE